MKDIDIYAMGTSNLRSLPRRALTISEYKTVRNDYDSILAASLALIIEKARTASEHTILWDVDLLAHDFAQRLSNQSADMEETSRVGSLWSCSLQRLISAHLGLDMSKHFRFLIETTSFFYSKGSQAAFLGCSSKEL